MALAPYNHVTGLIVQNNMEGGTNGATVTTGNSGGGSNTAFSNVQISGSTTVAFGNTSPIGDSLYVHVVGNGGFGLLRYDTAILGTPTNVYGGMYIRVPAYPASSTPVVEAKQADAGAQAMRLRILSTGFIRLSDAADATVFTTGTNAIPLNTWVRLEWHVNCTTGAYDVWQYNTADSTTADITQSGTGSFGTQIAQINHGRITTPEITIDYDNIGIATSKLGPRAVAGTSALPESVVSNAGAWTATGGTQLSVVRDASDATYVATPTSPVNAAIRYKLGPLSATDNVTVATKGAKSDNSQTVTRTVSIYNGVTLLIADSFVLTTTPTVRNTVTPGTVTAGVELEVVVSDNAT